MANQEHTRIIHHGAESWNRWRDHNPGVRPDVSGENLSANLRVANMNIWLDAAPIIDPQPLDLRGINLADTNLAGVNLMGQDFTGANLSRANLTGANLCGCRFIRANLAGACLDGCHAFGISVWTANLESASQKGIVITPPGEPTITCDNLAVAQFLYLILNNEAVRGVIDTMATKAILILGRFSPARKAVLDAIRDALRLRNYVPILFDFDQPLSRGLGETVSTLAHLSHFVIADITDATEVRAELTRIIPQLHSVPVQPIVETEVYVTFQDWVPYPWVLPVFRYASQSNLLANLGPSVIDPAERWLATH